MSKILKLNGGGSTYKKKKKKKSSSSYQGPHTGGYPSKKIKTTKPGTSGGYQHPQPSGGVDQGLAAAVANQAAKNAAIAADRATGKFSSSPASTAPSGFVDIGYGAGQVDPKLAAAVGSSGLVQGDPWVSTSGWKAPSGTGTTIGPVGMGGDPTKIVPPLPDDGDGDDDKVTTTEDEKKEDESEKKAKDKAKWLTDWWSKNGKGYRKYGDRKSIFSGDIRNTQAKVTAKIQDKLNKGYYKIVDGPNGEPLIIHASTGTPVNPFTGHIVDTQSEGAQGGGYQNDMARALGIDKEHAGVFSTEYQRGNGLSVSEMKPQHALRFLMKKNSKAFEEFFQMNKAKKGFNPFSVSAISSAMGSILNKITGPEALQVGNNLERAEWGKAIKNEDGSYSIKLTEKGAQGWSDSFNVADYVSPEAISKDKDKGWLSDLLGTRKFPDQPIDLTNLIDQGGYFEGMVPGASGSGYLTHGEKSYLNTNPEMTWWDKDSLQTLDPYLNPDIPFSNTYSYPDVSTLRTDKIPGTPSSWVNPEGTTSGVSSLTNYPQFTPEGYKIGAYNPSRDYSGGTDQTRTGDGSQSPLTFDVYGRPIKKYDYTGGPEQLYLGGGWKRDGQYIGSPWGTHHFKSGGIANFKPYGY
jgi:hypothetical protein